MSKVTDALRPHDEAVVWAYHRGGGWSGQPHETVYRLISGETVVIPGHHLRG